MSIEHTQYIFIDTETCHGTPYDFSFTIPVHHVQADPKTERLRVSLVKWSYRFDWYSIREPYNTFQVAYNYGNPVTITIPEGNYTYVQWAATLKILLNNVKTSLGCAAGETIDVQYHELTNKLSFIFPNSTAVSHFQFPREKCRAYGFINDEAKATAGTTLTSETLINFHYDEEHILILCEGIHTRKARNLSHNEKGQMAGLGNVLASVLVNNQPYETVTFDNDGGTYGHFLIEPHVHGNLHFRLKTLSGKPADFLPHSHMVIRIDVIYDDNSLQMKQLNILKSLEEYMRLSFVSQYLNAAPPAPSST